ncbi:MAG: DUF222 domain-containing protein [Jiangellaceae bacterium]|nr:DUF222 domain-containing protein [Jiangellaceae bacterium]
MTGTADVDYGYRELLCPGAVDPVREAAYVAGLDAGWDPLGLTDPAFEVVCGPDAKVDAAALFAALDDTGEVDPADEPAAREEFAGDRVPAGVTVPARMPPVQDHPPGPQLAGVLDAAALPEVAAFELVELVAGWQRIGCWAAARQAQAIMELSRRTEMRPTQAGERFASVHPLRVTGLEIAARLSLTPGQGEALAARARVFTEDLSATGAALQAGRIDVRKAEVIADVLRGHRLDLARAVEAEVLPDAEHMTAPRLRRALVRALHRLDSSTMATKAQQATERRFVQVTPAEDGMAWLEAYLPAADAAAINTALDAAAAAVKQADPADGRTRGQRRADALAEMGWLALATGRLGGCDCGTRLGSRHGRPVSVQVTVPLSSLLGVDEQPGELGGYGPITAEVARKLAVAGTWRRLVTDPLTGALLDYGRSTYRPPQDLVDHVLARDGCCRWPGCEHPATEADLDHTVPYPHGPTAVGNLGPFSGRHHLGKHHTRWKVHQPQPGRFEFISPTRHRYTVTPEPLGPILDHGAEGDPDPPPAPPPDAVPDEPPF